LRKKLGHELTRLTLDGKVWSLTNS
jgi:hypothetical protein